MSEPHHHIDPRRTRSRTLANLAVGVALAGIAAGAIVRVVGIAVAAAAVWLAVAALREARRSGGGGRGQAWAAIVLAPIAATGGLLILGVPAAILFAGGLFADAGIDTRGQDPYD